ncbi:MAG TPA: phospholipase D-like domain-containing protein [Rubrivivax sp.]|nr:phospholipase D-like domain-containing protein [Rubrivivax sp.]
MLRARMDHYLTIHGLVIVIALLIYVVTSHLLEQRRHPTAAIAWVLFILLLPYVALPIYLAFGSRKLARPRSARSLNVAPLPAGGSWVLQTLHALGQPAPAAYRDLRIHADGGEALRALWRNLDAAQQSIDLCTFILGRDALGRQVIDKLCAKARAGVRVRLLLDGMGSLMAGRPDLGPLRAAGASVALFVPPLHSPLKGRTNLRDHRKMLITDGASESRRLWSGGRNLAAEYFEGEPGKAAWHDLSFDLGGPLVAQALALFERDWAFAHTERAPQEMPAEDDGDASPAHGAQLVASGPDQVDDTVYALLLSAAYQARRHVALVTPYFVPDSALLMALCLAARRGVTVELLIPARSNHRLSDIARGRALRALAQAGARIWLAPQMLHAKLAVIDDQLALAGSANFDSRSLFLNYELMVAFHEGGDVRGFAHWFERERRTASPYVARRPGLARDVAEGMVLWVGFQL